LEYRATPLASPPSAIFLPPPAAPGKTATEAKTSSSTAPEPAAPLAVDARCIPPLFLPLLTLPASGGGRSAGSSLSLSNRLDLELSNSVGSEPWGLGR